MRVGVLDEEAGPGSHLRLELTGGVNRMKDRQIVRLADGQIVGAKRGGNMNDTCAVAGADEISGDDVGITLRDRRLAEAEERLVLLADQRGCPLSASSSS